MPLLADFPASSATVSVGESFPFSSAAEDFFMGREIFLDVPKAWRRSAARSRYSLGLSDSAVVAAPATAGVSVIEWPPFCILAVALVIKSGFWRLPRWSSLSRSCLLASAVDLNWREQR